jgi:hypothetical protein
VYPSGSTLPSWDGVKHFVHRAVGIHEKAEGISSNATSIKTTARAFLAGLDEETSLAWWKFMHGRKAADKIQLESLGVSFLANDRGRLFSDREVFLDVQLFDRSRSYFTPPHPSPRHEVDDTNASKKRRCGDTQFAAGVAADAEAENSNGVYCESWAYRLTTPILAAVELMIESAIPDERKCPENRALLKSELIKRMERGLIAKSARAELKLQERMHRDESRLIINLAGAVRQMRAKGSNTVVQKHILTTLATAVSDGARGSVAVVRRRLGITRGVAERGRSRRICFDNISSVSPDLLKKQKCQFEEEEGDVEGSDSEYDPDDADADDSSASDVDSNEAYSSDDDDSEENIGSGSDSESESIEMVRNALPHTLPSMIQYTALHTTCTTAL